MAIASTALLLVGAASSATVDLGCSGVDNWAAGSAYAQLKNAGLVAPETVDFPQIQVTLLAQQEIGEDLYRQIHEITFPLKSGAAIRVVTTSNASSYECSMSRVRVQVVNQVLGEYP